MQQQLQYRYLIGWLLEMDTGNGNIMNSGNGITWSDSVGGTSFSNSGHGIGIAYGTSGDGTSMWVAVGNHGRDSGNGNIMYSYDGISWSDSVGGTSFSTAMDRVLLTGPVRMELRCGWLLEV